MQDINRAENKVGEVSMGCLLSDYIWQLSAPPPPIKECMCDYLQEKCKGVSEVICLLMHINCCSMHVCRFVVVVVSV